MDDQQKALASKVTEKFEKPAREFLSTDINESLVCERDKKPNQTNSFCDKKSNF